MSYARRMKSSASPLWKPQKCIHYTLWCLHNCSTDYGHTQRLWRLKFSEMWHHVVWCINTNIFEEKFSTQNTEAARSSKTLVHVYQTTLCHIQEVHNCHVHPSKNLKTLTPSPQSHEYQNFWSHIITVSSPCLSDSCPYRDILMLHSRLCNHL
jgi:hypothetical protein